MISCRWCIATAQQGVSIYRLNNNFASSLYYAAMIATTTIACTWTLIEPISLSFQVYIFNYINWCCRWVPPRTKQINTQYSYVYFTPYANQIVDWIHILQQRWTKQHSDQFIVSTSEHVMRCHWKDIELKINEPMKEKRRGATNRYSIGWCECKRADIYI